MEPIHVSFVLFGLTDGFLAAAAAVTAASLAVHKITSLILTTYTCSTSYVVVVLLMCYYTI